MTARRLSLALPVLAAAVLAGCGADDSDAVADRSSAAPSTTAPVPSSSPEQTPAEPVAAIPVDAASQPWPAEVPYPVEGPAWAVYVAVADDGSETERDRVWAVMEELRSSTPYTSARGAGAVGCEEGAAEALGLDPLLLAAPVFLASEAEAELFAEKWDRPVVGPAQITEKCIA